MSAINPFLYLPEEVWTMIFMEIDPWDLGGKRLVTKKCLEFVNSQFKCPDYLDKYKIKGINSSHDLFYRYKSEIDNPACPMIYSDYNMLASHPTSNLEQRKKRLKQSGVCRIHIDQPQSGFIFRADFDSVFETKHYFCFFKLKEFNILPAPPEDDSYRLEIISIDKKTLISQQHYMKFPNTDSDFGIDIGFDKHSDDLFIIRSEESKSTCKINTFHLDSIFNKHQEYINIQDTTEFEITRISESIPPFISGDIIVIFGVENRIVSIYNRILKCYTVIYQIPPNNRLHLTNGFATYWVYTIGKSTRKILIPIEIFEKKNGEKIVTGVNIVDPYTCSVVFRIDGDDLQIEDKIIIDYHTKIIYWKPDFVSEIIQISFEIDGRISHFVDSCSGNIPLFAFNCKENICVGYFDLSRKILVWKNSDINEGISDDTIVSFSNDSLLWFDYDWPAYLNIVKFLFH